MGEREQSGNSFPRHGERNRMSKIGRGGNFGILSSCIQPSSNSFQPEQPLSWSWCPGTSQSQDGARRGQAPLSPSTSGHLFLLDFKKGQVLLSGLLGEDGSVLCELTSWCRREAACWGFCSQEHPGLCPDCWASFLCPRYWQDERNQCVLC